MCALSPTRRGHCVVRVRSLERADHPIAGAAPEGCAAAHLLLLIARDRSHGAAGAAALLGLPGQVTRRSASPAGQCQAVPFQCKISVATGGAESPTAQAWRDGGMKQRPSKEL